MRGLEDDDAGATMADIGSYPQNHKAERRPQGLKLKICGAFVAQLESCLPEDHAGVWVLNK